MNKKFVCNRCCKLIVVTENNLEYPFTCRSCLKYWQYVKSHSVKRKPIDILPWLHFDFHPHALSNAYNKYGLDVNGSCQVDPKTGITHVRINLYQFKNNSDLSELLRVLIHEFNHYAIQETCPEAMSKYDNIDYRTLEEWLRN